MNTIEWAERGYLPDGGLALVRLRQNDQPDNVPRVVIMRDQFMGQPVEQLGMTGFAAFPVIHGLDDARPQ